MTASLFRRVPVLLALLLAPALLLPACSKAPEAPPPSADPADLPPPPGVIPAPEPGADGLLPHTRDPASPYADKYPAPGEFSVMTFNVHQYGLSDRDGDPATLEPKPLDAASAVVEIIRQCAPDILVVQEMGGPDAWAEFKFRLRAAGLVGYAHEAFLRRGRTDLNIACLSRFPILENLSHVDDSYTIGPANFPVMRGFLHLRVQVAPSFEIVILGAHLKSKVFHSFGQAEMRRNEARLLGNHVRAVLKENPAANLLVLGDFNDDPTSAPLRLVRTEKQKEILYDLRPFDASGAAWTHRDNADVYSRIDYILVSPALLPGAIPQKTFIPESPALLTASDHRPLVASFLAAPRSPDSPLLDITTRTPPDLSRND